MTTLISIRCKDLGVDHDGAVSGTSLDDLIDCVEKEMKATGIDEVVTVPRDLVRDIVRSALLQSCRPAATRSTRLSHLVA